MVWNWLRYHCNKCSGVGRLNYVEHLQSLKCRTEVRWGAPKRRPGNKRADSEALIFGGFCLESEGGAGSFLSQDEKCQQLVLSPIGERELQRPTNKVAPGTWKETSLNVKLVTILIWYINSDQYIDINISRWWSLSIYQWLPMAGCQRWTFSYLGALPHCWNASNPENNRLSLKDVYPGWLKWSSVFFSLWQLQLWLYLVGLKLVVW